MFQFLVPFLCCVALVRGGALPLAVGLPGAQSVQSRSQDDYGNFNFGYDIVDEYGAANGRQESGDAHGNRAGSYTIRDADGRSRRVDYVADAYGFRATIGTNEPGTATSAAANANYYSAQGPIVGPPAPLVAPAPLIAPAPLAVAPSYAAPVVGPAPYAPYAAPYASPYASPLAVPAPIYRSPAPYLAAPAPLYGAPYKAYAPY